QSVTTSQNTPVVIVLTGSDLNGLPLTFAILSGPAHGSLINFNTNTGMVTYKPNTNYTGADSFTFSANDGQATSAPATVSLTIQATQPIADVQVFLFGPTNAAV